MPTSLRCSGISSIMPNTWMCHHYLKSSRLRCTCVGSVITKQDLTSSRISRTEKRYCSLLPDSSLNQVQQVKSQQLQDMIIKARFRQFRDRAVSHDRIKSEVFNKPWVSAQSLVDIGYLDGLDSYYEVHRQNADGVKEAQIDIPLRLNLGNRKRVHTTSTFTSFLLGRFTT